MRKPTPAPTRPLEGQIDSVHRQRGQPSCGDRFDALEYANKLFGAIVAAAYLSASGAMVTVDHKQAADLAERIARDGLDVREVADEIKGWTSRSQG
ncbi:hypothetical protein [Streptomyces sp. NPDC001675]